jgi:hypothetical protein
LAYHRPIAANRTTPAMRTTHFQDRFFVVFAISSSKIQSVGFLSVPILIRDVIYRRKVTTIVAICPARKIQLILPPCFLPQVSRTAPISRADKHEDDRADCVELDCLPQERLTPAPTNFSAETSGTLRFAGAPQRALHSSPEPGSFGPPSAPLCPQTRRLAP